MPYENRPDDIIDISYLGKIPVNSYRYSVVAKIAESYLSVSDNQDRSSLTQQVPFVIETLTHKELIECGICADREFPTILDEEGERLRIWPAGAKDFSVDENGNVEATVDNVHQSIGNTSQVITFLKQYHSPESDTAWILEEVLTELIMEAAEKPIEEAPDSSDLFQIAIDLSKALSSETNRRSALFKHRGMHKFFENSLQGTLGLPPRTDQ